MKTALIAGATGLVGNQVLNLLLNDPDYTKVIAITRTQLSFTHTKLENIVVDFEKLEDYPLQADDVYCCLGTTIAKAKSKEAFRRVDAEYPIRLGKVCQEKGATRYLLVSALGADKNASVFYNRVKGEVEEGIKNLHYKITHIFQPSLLLGPRTEERAGEKAATLFFKIFGFLVPAAYKAIDASAVARAMVHFAKDNTPGYFVHESKALRSF